MCLAHFCGQDYLLNVSILGFYAKRWPKCARVWRQKLMQHKIWSMIFFLTLAVRRIFHRKDFKWKKYRSTGLRSEKKGSFTCRNYQKNGRSHRLLFCRSWFFTISLFDVCCLGSLEDPIKVFNSWISRHRWILMMWIMVTERLYWRKVLCAASVLYGSGYLFLW